MLKRTKFGEWVEVEENWNEDEEPLTWKVIGEITIKTVGTLLLLAAGLTLLLATLVVFS